MKGRIVVAALAVTMTGCGAASGEEATTPGYDALAATVCPLLWEWQKDVGARINEMSLAATEEADATMRQALYLATFEDLGRKLDELAAAAGELPESAHTDAMRNEIMSGITVARREIDSLAAQVTQTAPADEPPGRRRVPSFFGEFEKVIDVVKPELAGYADGDLTAAFAALGSCQFGVKDVDDGVPRSNE